MEKTNNEKQSLILKGKMDIGFLFLVLLLLVVGLIMLFSASYPYAYSYFDDSYYFIKKQVIFAVIGIVGMLAVSKINVHFWKKFAWPLYIGANALLVLLLALPIQVPDSNVKRWLKIAGITFQPSEIAKFAVILLMAKLISKYYSQMKTLSFGVVKMGAVFILPAVLVAVEPHLSAAALIFLLGFITLVIGGIKKKHIVGLLGLGGAGIAALIVFGVVGYGSSRIANWINPWADPTGKGYQTIQSLLAIGSGGIMGRGFGQSHQKYLWLPEPQNDFIFAVICEELGLIGALVIILLLCLLVWRGFVVAMKAPDKYSAILAAGLTFQVGLQAALNILVVTNTLPNTGISLPFFSAGGTALMILLVEMGVVLAVSRTSNIEKT